MVLGVAQLLLSHCSSNLIHHAPMNEYLKFWYFYRTSFCTTKVRYIFMSTHMDATENWIDSWLIIDQLVWRETKLIASPSYVIQDLFCFYTMTKMAQQCSNTNKSEWFASQPTGGCIIITIAIQQLFIVVFIFLFDDF